MQSDLSRIPNRYSLKFSSNRKDQRVVSRFLVAERVLLWVIGKGVMSMRFGMICIVLMSVLVLGCQKALSENERIRKDAESSRKKAVRVSGTVLVDGKPQENVLVSLYKSDSPKPISPNVHIAAGPGGEFTFSTYENGDGLVPGDYQLTFEWHKIKFRRVKPVFEGPDKLNGRYSDPAQSKFQLHVVENEPQTDLKFNLKSK